MQIGLELAGRKDSGENTPGRFVESAQRRGEVFFLFEDWVRQHVADDTGVVTGLKLDLHLPSTLAVILHRHPCFAVSILATLGFSLIVEFFPACHTKLEFDSSSPQIYAQRD